MKEIFQAVRDQGRQALLEHEVYAILEQLGMPVPRHRFLTLEEAQAGELGDAADLPREAFLKLVSPKVLHKSDVGGVRRLSRVSAPAVREALSMMAASVPDKLWATVTGVLLCEAVPYRAGLGGELLLAMVESPDFGAVITAGFGGTAVEALVGATHPGQSTVLVKPGFTTPQQLARKLRGSLFFRWASGGVRGVEGRVNPRQLEQQLQGWMDALAALREGAAAQGLQVEELELNPLVLADDGRLVAVDALLRLGPRPAEALPFPHTSLDRALRPSSVAIMGASRKMNVGRIILGCILEGGFPQEKIAVVRSDMETMDGVACVPSLADLPGGKVDLLVLAVAAAAVPNILDEVLDKRLAQGVLLVSGGMGETEDGKEIEQRINALLEQHGGSERPVLMGNNSLGFISKAQGFDSLFIPRSKLPRPDDAALGDRVALVSQSGAFMITRASKLDWLTPAYQLSIGNQLDARISHFVEALLEEPQLTTLALYIEGFKPGDGARLLDLTRAAVAGGRDLIMYRAGRSALGRGATMGHTASIAGDYQLFSQLMADAGALVAHTFDDFTDLVTLSATLRGKTFTGRGTACLSNAGFESVGMADNHGKLEPCSLAPETTKRLTDILDNAGIAHLVNVRLPLDITPMAGDALYEQVIRALLDDPAVDAAVIGMVPLTPMAQTLPRGASNQDVFDAPSGYARRMATIFNETDTPLVTVLDAGAMYDPMASLMQSAGVPVFRSGDRATRVFAKYLASRTRD